MSEYKLLMSIINREQEDAYMDYFKKNGVKAVFSTLCSGTASKSMLDYLGLESNSKVMLSSMVSGENASRLMSGLVSRMGINLPGTGIALTVPVGSIAGTASLRYLAEGQENQSKNETAVEKVSEIMYSLVVIISEKGCSDMVMDAAREAGARGGTVVHAKGTGKEFAAKFFGVSIAAEKEIVYIVTRRSDKDAIMKSVIEKAGPATDAKAAVFSLPVEDVVGLMSVMKED